MQHIIPQQNFCGTHLISLSVHFKHIKIIVIDLYSAMNKNYFPLFVIFLFIFESFLSRFVQHRGFCMYDHLFWQLAVQPARSHTLHDGDDGPLTIVDCFHLTTMMVNRFSFPLQFLGLSVYFCFIFCLTYVLFSTLSPDPWLIVVMYVTLLLCVIYITRFCVTSGNENDNINIFLCM